MGHRGPGEMRHRSPTARRQFAQARPRRRRAGAQCGSNVWTLAKKYFDGSITNTPIALSIRSLNPGQCELRYSTLRGFYYKVQSTPELALPFADDGAGFARAVNSSVAQTNAAADPKKLYRVVREP